MSSVSDQSGLEERFYGRLGEVVKESKTVLSDTPPSGTEGPYVTQYLYDTFGRLQQMVYPDGEVLSYGYDAGGLLRSAQGAKGNKTYVYIRRMDYDRFEQRAFIQYGNNVSARYTYDPLNRRLTNLHSRHGASLVLQDLSYARLCRERGPFRERRGGAKEGWRMNRMRIAPLVVGLAAAFAACSGSPGSPDWLSLSRDGAAAVRYAERASAQIGYDPVVTAAYTGTFTQINLAEGFHPDTIEWDVSLALDFKGGGTGTFDETGDDATLVYIGTSPDEAYIATSAVIASSLTITITEFGNAIGEPIKGTYMAQTVDFYTDAPGPTMSGSFSATREQ